MTEPKNTQPSFSGFIAQRPPFFTLHRISIYMLKESLSFSSSFWCFIGLSANAHLWRWDKFVFHIISLDIIIILKSLTSGLLLPFSSSGLIKCIFVRIQKTLSNYDLEQLCHSGTEITSHLCITFTAKSWRLALFLNICCQSVKSCRLGAKTTRWAMPYVVRELSLSYNKNPFWLFWLFTAYIKATLPLWNMISFILFYVLSLLIQSLCLFSANFPLP